MNNQSASVARSDGERRCDIESRNVRKKVKAHDNVPSEQRVKIAATRDAGTIAPFTDNFGQRRPLDVGKRPDLAKSRNQAKN